MLGRGKPGEIGEGSVSTSDAVCLADMLLLVWEGGATTVRLSAPRTFAVGRSGVRHDHGLATVVVDHPSVSRHHATFTFDGARLHVVDEGSRNGTTVRGTRLSRREPAVIPPGDVVTLGDVIAVFQCRRSEADPTTPIGMWQQIDRVLPLVARGNISILILGETGVGKEVTANTIHRLSPRRDAPLVSIHCAALPESLLEAELFGFERGAFTGAAKSKPGLIESAHGGTIFLDEVTEIPLSTQAKLLRVVETKCVTRLGAIKGRNIDVRFVAAANRDVDALVEAGTFRSDLYYRLAGFTLNVPSLRARIGDVAALSAKFVADAARSLGRAPLTISPEAMKCLQRYTWPGNVRELRNALECAVLLCEESSVIRPDHLPPRVLGLGAAPVRGARSLREEIEALERTRILEALDRAGGNQSRAARELGISRRLLVERLDHYGAPRPRKAVSIGIASKR